MSMKLKQFAKLIWIFTILFVLLTSCTSSENLPVSSSVLQKENRISADQSSGKDNFIYGQISNVTDNVLTIEIGTFNRAENHDMSMPGKNIEKPPEDDLKDSEIPKAPRQERAENNLDAPSEKDNQEPNDKKENDRETHSINLSSLLELTGEIRTITVADESSLSGLTLSELESGLLVRFTCSEDGLLTFMEKLRLTVKGKDRSLKEEPSTPDSDSPSN